MRGLPWGKALVALWAGLIAVSEVKALLPASHWYEPGALTMADTPHGVCPAMSFARVIKRPFHGEWLVTLQRQLPTGGWTMARPTWRGANDYRPDVVLPDPLTFDWWAWIGPEDCDWPPGIYRVLTEWTIHPGGPARYARVTSTPFRVLP